MDGPSKTRFKKGVVMNVDTKLRSGNAKPRRELSATFTQTITNHIQAHPRPRRRMSLKELFMKILDKPAIALAGIVATIAISGTAYAAVVNWPNISAMFGGEQQTEHGRIVKVDVQNCRTDNAFTIMKPADQRGEPRYFMVKKESTLTNDQVTQMVFGNCEQGAQSEVLLNTTTPMENVVGGYIDNTVTAISAQSITLESQVPIGESIQRVKKTFNRIDPAVQVYYKSEAMKFSDLKVGDRVGFSYRATGKALSHSETLNPLDLNTDEATIVLIIKNTPAASAAIDYQKHYGKEFEEVVPCEFNLTGYCDVSEYHQNNMQQRH
jgi:hypothetical protein